LILKKSGLYGPFGQGTFLIRRVGSIAAFSCPQIGVGFATRADELSLLGKPGVFMGKVSFPQQSP
jgi:hypothetical protein